MYKIRETKETKQDLRKLVAHMLYSLMNGQAASNFLNQYEKQLQNLIIFPFGYRRIGIKYQGYEIRMKPFLTYNIFFVVDEKTHQITILRVLKDRQNWKNMLHNEDEYSF